jgi:hypothetical protein
MTNTAKNPNFQNIGLKMRDNGDGTYTPFVTVDGLTVTTDTVNLDTSDIQALLGALADAAVTDPAAAASLIALAKGNLSKLEAIRLLCAASTPAGENLIGAVKGNPARVASATYISPGVSGARTANTLIGNDATAANVVPITFTMARPKGRITACRAIVTPASSTVVYTNLDVDLVMYEAMVNTPFAAAGYPANNAAITAATNVAARTNQLARLGTFSFNNAAWRKGNNQIISSTVTGMSGTQKVGLLTGEVYVPFDLTSAESLTIRALAVLQSAWNDGNIANNFDFVLDVDYD